MLKPIIRWGVMWSHKNRKDGACKHIICENGIPPLFRTRKEAREFIAKTYGYIKDSPTLRKEPHGWRMPVPIRVEIRRWS